MKISIPTPDLERWREHVLRQLSSGLSRAAYCRQHGVKESRLFYWQRRLETAGLLKCASTRSLTPSRFAAVEVMPQSSTGAAHGLAVVSPPSSSATSSIRLAAGGVTIDCPATIDPRQLAELVRTLKEA